MKYLTSANSQGYLGHLVLLFKSDEYRVTICEALLRTLVDLMHPDVQQASSTADKLTRLCLEPSKLEKLSNRQVKALSAVISNNQKFIAVCDKVHNCTNSVSKGRFTGCMMSGISYIQHRIVS